MSQSRSSKLTTTNDRVRLSTFSGVFTPSILTILGIILFMRLGYVVGAAGLGRALIIIGVANAISLLTTFSLSAIATNLRVKGGGDYYLISRTLGVEFGGAIGIVLFLAHSVSVAFYCIGFGEAVSGMFSGTGDALSQIIAAIAVGFLFIFAWLGADWATRFQYVVMALLGAALASFFIGGTARWEFSTLVLNWSGPTNGVNIWVLFAIFFPAVTGFTQGVSMSGDLQDPGKSLPRGTFAAVLLSIVVYFGAAFVLAGSSTNHLLVTDYAVMKRAAFMDFLVDAGVIAATLSSGMASFLGAPRILQSLAGDRVFPFLAPFAKGYGPMGNPRRGVLLSAGIAYATIFLGKLNLIAPVVSMFFLISYGLLNYATYYEARSASPSFRPLFRWYDYRLSLLGWLACLGAMLAIDLAAGIIAVSVLFAIYHYLGRTAGPARWADSRRSAHLQRIRENLLLAAGEPEHPRDWRPVILAFSENSARRERLLRFSSWLEGGSGITTVVHVVEGEGAKVVKLREEAEAELVNDISLNKLPVFPLVVSAPNLQAGIHILVQAFGLGPVKANTILMNWREQLSKGILGIGERRYARNIQSAFRSGCNIVLLNAEEDHWPDLPGESTGQRRIDVWWQGDASSRLMLLLAYLVTRHELWGGVPIRVLAGKNDQTSAISHHELQEMLKEVRIDAEPMIVETVDSKTMIAHSADAALVFIPFQIKADRLMGPFGGDIDALLSRLPLTALILAAEDIDLDAEPEEGRPGEVAAALDALTGAEKRDKEAQKDAEKATIEAEKKKEALEAAIAAGQYQDVMTLVKELLDTRETAMKLTRRAAKTRIKAEDAARTAESLGALREPKEAESDEPSMLENNDTDSP